MKNVNSKKATVLSCGLLATMTLATNNALAEGMDHSQHGGHDTSQHEEHDISQHKGHDTGAAAHIHHGHGKGAWMFEYRFMRMDMDGLLNGTDSVSTQTISGTTQAMNGSRSVTPGKQYQMSPTQMTMDMHMLMVMYGISDELTLMGMINYLDNEMDMVMHMTMAMNGMQMDMTGKMETSGIGDTVIGGMYKIDDKLTASLGLSLPTGSIDEDVDMNMSGTNPMTGMPMTTSNPGVRAPYPMQLGSGTYDFIPSITYADNDGGNFGWGGQATYTLRLSDNDNNYTLGDKLEITGWGKYAVNQNYLISGRLAILDWDKIDGQDPNIMPMMAPTSDPNAQGGTRADLFIGVNGFFGGGHMLGLELGIPVHQDLNGPQMETKSIISIGYQYMM